MSNPSFSRVEPVTNQTRYVYESRLYTEIEVKLPAGAGGTNYVAFDESDSNRRLIEPSDTMRFLIAPQTRVYFITTSTEEVKFYATFTERGDIAEQTALLRQIHELLACAITRRAA